ncbi:MAG: hypothetical protein IT384_24455 [Deltaproteobacteria bacterium]|nr:hypothetical protein [Deltaproteobacteria bacterium]
MIRRGIPVAAELTPSRPGLRKFVGVYCAKGERFAFPEPTSDDLPWRYRVKVFEVEAEIMRLAEENNYYHEKEDNQNVIDREAANEAELDVVLLELVGPNVLFRRRGDTAFPI